MPSQTGQDELGEVRDVVGRLVLHYGSLDEATVEAAVREACQAFRGARVRAFVPILVERRARAVLDRMPPAAARTAAVPAAPEAPVIPVAPAQAPVIPVAPGQAPAAALP